MGEYTGYIIESGKINGNIRVGVSLTGSLSLGVPTYNGPYSIIPSNETKTLSTRNKTLNQNITIEPIPSNYGLVTWNGSVLTIS